MFIAALAAASLVVAVAVDGTADAPYGRVHTPASIYGKAVAVRPLVRSATECVARTVTEDPRFPELAKSGNVNNLIVDSMSTCAEAMRAMIEAYDQHFGAGMGETFFLGPYLDKLPTAVHSLIQDKLPDSLDH